MLVDFDQKTQHAAVMTNSPTPAPLDDVTVLMLCAAVRSVLEEAQETVASVDPEASWPSIAKLMAAGRDIISLSAAMSVIVRRAEL